MPHIDHIGLWVKDLDAAADFYVSSLGATAGRRYHNPKTGFSSAFVTWGDGARLELMNLPDLAEPGATVVYGYAHISLSLGSEAAVDELTARLASAGHPVLSGPRRTGDGYYESVVLDPEGNRVELAA